MQGGTPETITSKPPLVVAAKIDNAYQLTAVDDAATALGLFEGLPLATARAMVPSLEIVDDDPVADHAALCHIADWCDRFTPLVALDGLRGLFLDISGCAHLFGGEAALMASACAALSRQGFVVSGAIAGTAVAARALARSKHGQVVPCGGEAKAVARLPVAVLGVNEKIVRGLQRAGLKTIGDVASRKPSEIAARFGEDFVFTLQQALGQDDAPISPRKPAPDFVAEKRFAEPVATADVITATLSSLSDMLMAAMERHGKGARRLVASFFRTDGVVRNIVVDAGQAVTQTRIVNRLFAEKLDTLADPLDPGFGFDLIRLSASDTVVTTHIQQGFDTAANAVHDVEQLVDRLSARIGRRRILVHLPQGTHMPERATLALPAQQYLGEAVQAQWEEHIAGEPPLRPLRLLAQPEPISVIAQVPDGPPAQFRWRSTVHVVAHVEGPERIAMEWWRFFTDAQDEDDADDFARIHPPQDGTALEARINEQILTRDYFRTEDQDGARYWIFRSGIYAREVAYFRWFMHGLFA